MTLKRAFLAAVVFLLGAIAAAGTIYLLSGTGDQFAYDAADEQGFTESRLTSRRTWREAWEECWERHMEETRSGNTIAYDAENL